MAEINSTTGHEGEVIDVQGLKASLQKLKTNHIDTKANTSSLGTAATKNVPTSGNASNTQVVMGNDSRLTNPRVADGGNSDTVDNYHIAVVSSMPASPSVDTIYIVK